MDEEEEGDRNSSEALETYLLTTMMVGDKDTCTDALAAKNTPISTAPAVKPAITKRKAMHGHATASLNEQSKCDDGGWRITFERFLDVWLNGQFSPPTVEMGHQPK